MKDEHSWRSKSLQQLENEVWGEPTFDSRLVTTCHELRKKPVQDFETEDLRIMIGQEIGLKYLIPNALEVLANDVFAEGDYYPGDLLKSVLTIDKAFWDQETQMLKTLVDLMQANKGEIGEREPELLELFDALILK